ncbi:MAG: lytic transglycosylase domain-containing protein [Clostridium sp.]|uniref:lytic transglycosylase domain-containing protein n=1 Tax=Clostridium sp. TaxID=1506 RepID=UPI003F2CC8B6
MKFKKLIIGILIAVIIIASGLFVIKNYVFPYAHKDIVDKYSKEYDLDPLFVLSVMKAESGFNENAHSHKDAIGLMQITKSTGKWIWEQMGGTDFNSDVLYNEDTNIKMGCWYLDNLSKEFNGNRELVLAAYNAGRGNVNKWLKNSAYSKDGENLDVIPFKETKNYVDRINFNYEVYKFLYGE